MMDVILLERVEKLGQMGDVVKVKDGYARNYLLPQKKALRASAENLSKFESERVQLETANLSLRKEAEAMATKLEGLSVVLLRQASDSAQLYGSVNARDLAVAVTEAGFTVERKQVILDQPIKTLGIHVVRVSLHPEVSVTITANVARTHEEAEIQAGRGSAAEAGEQIEATEETTEEAFEEGEVLGDDENPATEESVAQDSDTEAET